MQENIGGAGGTDPLTGPHELPGANPLPQAPIPPVTSAQPRSPSLRNNSVARLASDLLGIVLALVAATITARLLGPAGKGYYSSLVLLGGLFVQIFSAGMGEAAIVLTGRGRTSLQVAASATSLAMMPLALAGGAIFFVTASLVLPAVTGEGHAVLWAAMLVATNVLLTTSVCFLVAKEEVVTAAALSALAAGLTTVLLWILVAAIDLGVAGALAAGVLGSGVALVATILLVYGSGLSARPRWAGAYIRSAARFGAALQFSNLLVALTARLDLVLVYRLSTPSEAGNYSIALTIGALVGSIPIAVSYAAFPRLAALEDAEARTLTGQVFRIGVAGALIAGVILAAAAPIAIPLLFGRPYAGAVLPTLILIPGGVLWSAQWLLCRAAAARGAPKALLASFALSFGVMIALDFALIGPLGGVGAAVASLVAPCFGLTVAWILCSRDGPNWHDLVPRWNDAVSLFANVRAMLNLPTQAASAEGR